MRHESSLGRQEYAVGSRVTMLEYEIHVLRPFVMITESSDKGYISRIVMDEYLQDVPISEREFIGEERPTIRSAQDSVMIDMVRYVCRWRRGAKSPVTEKGTDRYAKTRRFFQQAVGTVQEIIGSERHVPKRFHAVTERFHAAFGALPMELA